MTETLSRPAINSRLPQTSTVGVSHSWRPEPGSVPPPHWQESASDQEKLAFACATLRRYGISTSAGLGATRDEVATRLRDALKSRFPEGDGACVYWTAGAQSQSLDPSGRLREPLEVHVVGNGVAEAATAAFQQAGLTVRSGGSLDVLTVGG